MSFSFVNPEDAKLHMNGPFVWRKSTRDSRSLVVDHVYVGGVLRRRSWKKLGDDKPWRVELLGSTFTNGIPEKNEFRTLDEARNAAEKSLRNVVRRLFVTMALESGS